MSAHEGQNTLSSYLPNVHKANEESDDLGGNFTGMLMDAQLI